MNLVEWAVKWGIPYEALNDLNVRLGAPNDPVTHPSKGSEADVQAAVRLEAPKKGVTLWRNNVGGAYDKSGRFVRFGLANDSEALNKRYKSADLIGIRPIAVTEGHVGQTIGQFVSREVKAPSWTFTGTKREEAQRRWALFISSKGGDAAFATQEGTL